MEQIGQFTKQIFIYVLQKTLGRFIQFEESQLSVSLWNGEVEFRKLRLKLPAGRGEIGHLKIKMPSFWALSNTAVVVETEKVLIFADSSTENFQNPQIQKTQVENDVQELSERITRILTNVQVCISDVIVRYQCPNDGELSSKALVLSLGSVQLTNCDANWNAVFTAEYTSESFKLLEIQNVSIYLESEQDFVFQNWSMQIKAVLSYQSVQVPIPDVRVDIQVQSKRDTPLLMRCTLQQMEAMGQMIEEFSTTNARVEAKDTKVGKIPGYAMVLSYANHWLLSDCKDLVEASWIKLSDSDEEDEFVDALSPPALSVTWENPMGFIVEFVHDCPSRCDFTGLDTTKVLPSIGRWEFSVDRTSFKFVESCLEYDVQVNVGAIRLTDCSDSTDPFNLLSTDTEIACHCIVPTGIDAVSAYTFIVPSVYLMLDRNALGYLYSIFDPIQLPSSKSSDAKALSLPKISLDLSRMKIECPINRYKNVQQNCLGMVVEDFRIETEPGENYSLNCSCFELFSDTRSCARTGPLLVTLKTRPESTCGCSHTYDDLCGATLNTPNVFGLSSERVTLKDSEDARYMISAELPALCATITSHDYCMLNWIIGSWLLTKKRVPESKRYKSTQLIRHTTDECLVKVSVKLPKIDFNLDTPGGKFQLQILKPCLNGVVCSRVKQFSFTISSIGFSHETRQHLLQVEAATGSSSGFALRYSSCPRITINEPNGAVLISRSTTEVFRVGIGIVSMNIWPDTFQDLSTVIFSGTQELIYGAETYSSELLSQLTEEAESIDIDCSRTSNKLYCEAYCETESVSIVFHHGAAKVAKLDVQRTKFALHLFDETSHCPRCSSIDISGSLSGIQLEDLTLNSNEHRVAISSWDATGGSVGSATVEFFIGVSCSHGNSYGGNSPVVQLRIDSVQIVFLNRFYAELWFYIYDHLGQCFAVWGQDPLPVINQAMLWYQLTLNPILAQEKTPTEKTSTHLLDLLVHDLMFKLPRSTIRQEVISLHCSTGKMWSNYLRGGKSNFMESGMFEDEALHLRASRKMTRLDLLRRRSESGDMLEKSARDSSKHRMHRRELHVLRRDIRRQCSELLVKSTELGAALRTSQSDIASCVHEGRTAGDDMMSEMHEIESILENLQVKHEILRKHLVFINNGLNSKTNILTRQIDVIREDLNDVAKLTSISITTAFFDALDASVSDSSGYGFELLDLIVETSQVDLGTMVEHTQLNGKMQYLPVESGSTYQPLLQIELSMSEFNVTATEKQYESLIGMIVENFQERTTCVDDSGPNECESCKGHHYLDQMCDAYWLRVPIRASHASLRLRENDIESQKELPVSEFQFEDLKVEFCMKTNDVFQLNAVADTVLTIDQRVKNLAVIKELITPLPGRGPQIVFFQESSWTRSLFDLQISRSCIKGNGEALYEIEQYFVKPFVLSYEPSSPRRKNPFIKSIENWDSSVDNVVTLELSESAFCFLDDFNDKNSQVLTVCSDISYKQRWYGKIQSGPGGMEQHMSFHLHGVYFANLPLDMIDTSTSIVNSFKIAFDHFYDVTTGPHLNRRIALALYPVVVRISVRDFSLLQSIYHNVSPGFQSFLGGNDPNDPCPVIDTTVHAMGQIGNLRFVLVNNSLGVPVLDLELRDIIAELYNRATSLELSLGCAIAANYFNNRIYRWEPLIEPFAFNSDIEQLQDTGRKAIVDVPNPVNINVTHALTSLLTVEALRTDFVTTSAKTTSPFWFRNSTGLALRISFRRGRGRVQQHNVADGECIPLDCRDSGDMNSFDNSTTDILDNYHKGSFAATHSLFVWACDVAWESCDPVIVDVVGKYAVELRKSNPSACAPPAMAADISLQDDCSKLIDLHSQLLMQNWTPLPLSVWMMSPAQQSTSAPGHVESWVLPRYSERYVPLNLAYSSTKVCIRPSDELEWGPVQWTYQDQKKTQGFKGIGEEFYITREKQCVCYFFNPSSTSTRSIVRSNEGLHPGMTIRDLQLWQCIYDVIEMKVNCINSEVKPREESKYGSKTLSGIDFEEGFHDDSASEQELNGSRQKMRDITTQLEDVGRMVRKVQSMHVIRIKPTLQVVNRLASPVAYRVLNQSLQLVAEGVLSVGTSLPIFQINLKERLLVAFRLENYNWSKPELVLDPSDTALGLPYRDKNRKTRLIGRKFGDRSGAVESQDDVPSLDLRLKLCNRDIIVFCPVWLINHSGMTLEYCKEMDRSSNRSSTRDPTGKVPLRYTHPQTCQRRNPQAPIDHDFELSSIDSAENFLERLRGSTSIPSAISVMAFQAKKLYNSQFFGKQSPFVKAILIGATGEQITSDSSRPAVAGGCEPTWTTEMHNSLLLRIPKMSLKEMKIRLEVRNVRFGVETKLGFVKIDLDHVITNPLSYADPKWYTLCRDTITPAQEQSEVLLVFAVGSSQTLNDEINDAVAIPSPKEEIASQIYPLRVYLPQNRFTSIVVDVKPEMLGSEVFRIITKEVGHSGWRPSDFVFLELRKSRFTALRSAGRTEAERWWGKTIHMNTRIGTRGSTHGVHLTHRKAMTTLRCYNEEGQSTVSVHHQTPKANFGSSDDTLRNQPAQWSEVLDLCWDSIQLRTLDSLWSKGINLRRTTMGNVGTAQVITVPQRRENSGGQYDLSLWTAYGAGEFGNTIVATLVPRYVFINLTQKTINIIQSDLPESLYQLDPDAIRAHHWHSAEGDKSLQVTFGNCSSLWKWSGRFTVNAVGTIYVKMRLSDSPHVIKILQCDIELIGGSILVKFRDEEEMQRRWPPYRIDNLTLFRIQIKQSNWEDGAALWDEIMPGSSEPYAWDDLSVRNPQLIVRFMHVAAEKDLMCWSTAAVGEYSLDEMIEHKAIQLQRSLPSFSDSNIEGYLLKRDNFLKHKWNRRYFRLHDSTLYYFISKEDLDLHGIVDLCAADETTGQVVQIIAYDADDLFQFSIKEMSKVYDLRAENKAEMTQWIQQLRQATRPVVSPQRGKPGIKTSIIVRVRADGPTKVLELTEQDVNEVDDIAAPLSQEVEPEKASAELNLTFSRIAVSIVDSKPQEILYLCVNDIETTMRSRGEKTQVVFTFGGIQADNQLEKASFSTMLCPSPRSTLEDEDEEERDVSFQCTDCGFHKPNKDVAFHFCCVRSDEPGNTYYIERCSMWLTPMLLLMDQGLLAHLKQFVSQVQFRTSSSPSTETSLGSNPQSSTSIVADFISIIANRDLDILANWAQNSTTTARVGERKVYFAILRLHPIEIDLTYRSDAIAQKDISETIIGEPSGLLFLDLDNAPLRLNSLLIEHAFGSVADLGDRIIKHYTRQLWKQIHRVLGSFDFLGNPVGFLDHIGTGVRDFIYEPLEGFKAGGGFRKGLAKGTSSLVNNALDGTFDAASKISGALSQSVAHMTLDQSYQHNRARARRKNVKNVREGVVQGARELGLGVYEGLSGIVMGPYIGARDHGALGLVKGSLTGIIGIPLKPAAGVLDFASRASQGVRHRDRNQSPNEIVTRVRLPRVFGRHGQLQVYKLGDVLACEILDRVSAGTLKGESVLFHFEVIEKVPLQDVVSKARQGKNDPLPSEPSDVVYTLSFEQTQLGLFLETDYYKMNVIVQKYVGTEHQGTIEAGDILNAVNDVDVTGISFKETMKLLRGTSRPLHLKFLRRGLDIKPVASSPPRRPTDELIQRQHLIIVTDVRVLYVDIMDIVRPVVDWSTPLCFIDHVALEDCAIILNLRVGVNSLPSGPRVFPSLEQYDLNDPNMETFRSVMLESFNNSKLAHEQELWPSQTGMNGALLKQGTFTTTKRWFVLNRNCLYHFLDESCKELRGVTPLGQNTSVERHFTDPRSFVLKSSTRDQLETIQIRNEKTVTVRKQPLIQLTSTDVDTLESWVSAIEAAGGKGLRHAPAVQTEREKPCLEISCINTPNHIIKALYAALRKTHHVFN